MDERIALIGENSIEYVKQLIHIWNDGDCAVLIDWRIPFLRVKEMMEEASVSKCYIDKKLCSDYIEESDSVSIFTYDRNTYSASHLPDEIYQMYQISNSVSEAVILYSSGTTGKAKGIILTHQALNLNSDAILAYMMPTQLDCIYISKTISHSSTITGELLVGLKSKAKIVISPTIVPPRHTIQNLIHYKATIIGLNPTLLSLYLDEIKRGDYDLSNLKTIYVSGFILSETIYQKAKEVWKGVNIYNVYGLSEAGPRVTAQRMGCDHGTSVGKPIQGVEVVVVDENGSNVENGERGFIHVNTPSRFKGYVSSNTKLESLYHNWLNTGDIGYMDEYGELHIVARADDLIIIDAHKIYPNDVEKYILSCNEVEECIVGLAPVSKNKLFCLYTGDLLNEKKIYRYLQKCLMLYEIPKRYVRVDEIPKTKNQKYDMVFINEIFKKIEENMYEC